MKPNLLYRIAALVLALMAAGHTYGFLHFRPTAPGALAVRQAMDSVSFQAGGATYTFGGFYVGFGLSLTAYLIFSAFLAWYLGSLASREPRAIGPLGPAFCLLQVVLLALTLIYLPRAPAVLSALVALATGWASWAVARSS